MDQHQRLAEADLARNLDAEHLWIFGLFLNEDGEIESMAPSDASYWSECDCPEACLRDHDLD